MAVLLASLALVAMGFVTFSGNAWAQSNDAILPRLEAIEASNAKLAKENAALRERIRHLEGDQQRIRSQPIASATPASRANFAAARSDQPLTAMASARSPMVTKAPVRSDLPAPFNWTGFHVGVHTGYDINREIPSDGPASISGFSGWLFGANTGFDYQFSPHWVAGVEVDYSFADIQQTNDHNIGFDTTQIVNVGTARGRLGYAWDRYLAYVTGGYAWGALRDRQFIGSGQLPPNGAALTSTAAMKGYAVGAGAQWAATDNLNFKVEYLYLDFGNQTLTFAFPPPIGTVGGTARISGQSVKAGVAWLFH